MMTWINRMIAGLLAVAGFAGLGATALGIGAFFGEHFGEIKAEARREAASQARPHLPIELPRFSLTDELARIARESTIREGGQAPADVNSDRVGKDATGTGAT